jgi:hypothetical protein
MRIRQVKPSWWLDKTLRKALSADEREFYIGLWMQADDAGWFVWDIERVAAELYPYTGVSHRERNVAKWAAHLVAVQPDSPHLELWSCGHAQVPKMAGHQRITGKQTVSIKEKHMACRDAVRLSEPLPDDVSPGRVGNTVGNGTERNGTDAREAAPSGAPRSEFQSKVPRATALGKAS